MTQPLATSQYAHALYRAHGDKAEAEVAQRERIAIEAGKLATFNQKETMSSREIQTAVRLLLPGELAKFAVSEGTKAVTKCSSLPNLGAGSTRTRVLRHLRSSRTNNGDYYGKKEEENNYSNFIWDYITSIGSHIAESISVGEILAVATVSFVTSTFDSSNNSTSSTIVNGRYIEGTVY